MHRRHYRRLITFHRIKEPLGIIKSIEGDHTLSIPNAESGGRGSGLLSVCGCSGVNGLKNTAGTGPAPLRYHDTHRLHSI
jgi:hypothetical protein